MKVKSLIKCFETLKDNGIENIQSMNFDKFWYVFKGDGFELGIPSDDNDKGKAYLEKTIVTKEVIK